MSAKPKRLLIVGGGSSGLITTKTALQLLSDWQIVCFEKSDNLRGCWGHPYDGFVSTTTRFATQFACLPEFDPVMSPGDDVEFKQFFRNGEYGEYLQRFVNHFGLRPHIKLNHRVLQIRKAKAFNQWMVTYNSNDAIHLEEVFDAIIVCTGLVSQPGEITIDQSCSSTRVVTDADQIENQIYKQTVVVCGGGESAVDIANRLAESDRENRVYLSLRSGVRVSPRYHPIRGVPSDYLRNRLMLSIHPDIRNWLGDWFVRARIRFERGLGLRRRRSSLPTAESRRQRIIKRKRDWAMRLHLAAGEDLFDMFHNKSDGFLDAVADGRLRIIGPPKDDSWQTFDRFQRDDRTLSVAPDTVVPAIGFRSSLSGLFEPAIELPDFYLGCVHSKYDNLFAVGFARPVIGNIPSISEIQAGFACRLLAEKARRPSDLVRRNAADWEQKRRRFTTLASRLKWVYPVEMFDYCDRLAGEINMMPTLGRCGSLAVWIKTRLAAASTWAYFVDQPQLRNRLRDAPIHLPWGLIGVLLLLKPIDWSYRVARRALPGRRADRVNTSISGNHGDFADRGQS